MKHIILTPTYNEKENIERLVREVFSRHPDIHIRVIDDNSPDGTAELVKKLMLEFPNLSILSRPGKQGLGKAYIHGFKEVFKEDFSHVITMDADLSHHPKYLAEMLEKSKDYDVVTGSRYIRGGGSSGWELWRRILSRGANLYARTITGIPIRDLTAGFNCIRVEYLKKINLDKFDASGYAFLMELKYLLYKAGANMTEIPIVFANRTGGESKMAGHIIAEGVLAPWKIRFKK